MSDVQGGTTERSEEDSRSGGHALPEGAPPHPLIDLARDPNPGKADHAKPDEDENSSPSETR